MKRIKNVPGAAPVVAAYSLGVISDRPRLYTSGQVALTPEGKLLEGTIEEETHQVMANLEVILGAAGCRFVDVVMANIFIEDRRFFQAVNSVYAQYFPADEVPARACVVAAPPVEGAHVEISMIAELPAPPTPSGR